MPPIARKSVDNRNGLRMSYLECGEKPGKGGFVVAFLHGFPDLSSTWVKQMQACADQGYWAVAPDQRGYGETTGWDAADVDSYRGMNLARDVVGLLQAIGASKAVLVGHDFGTTPAFYTALARPDLIVGLCMLSIPLCTAPPVMVPNAGRAIHRNYAAMRKKGFIHYQEYFSSDAAVAEWEKDVRGNLVTTLYQISHDSEAMRKFDARRLATSYPLALEQPKPAAGGEASGFFNQASRQATEADLPWMDPSAVDGYHRAFQKTGFRAALSWYRNLPRNVDDLQIFAGFELPMPYRYIVGRSDFCLPLYKDLHERTRQLPRYTGSFIIEGAGHWVQGEKPQEVNKLLLEFLQSAVQYSEAPQQSRL